MKNAPINLAAPFSDPHLSTTSSSEATTAPPEVIPLSQLTAEVEKEGRVQSRIYILREPPQETAPTKGGSFSSFSRSSPLREVSPEADHPQVSNDILEIILKSSTSSMPEEQAIFARWGLKLEYFPDPTQYKKTIATLERLHNSIERDRLILPDPKAALSQLEKCYEIFRKLKITSSTQENFEEAIGRFKHLINANHTTISANRNHQNHLIQKSIPKNELLKDEAYIKGILEETDAQRDLDTAIENYTKTKETLISYSEELQRPHKSTFLPNNEQQETLIILNNEFENCEKNLLTAYHHLQQVKQSYNINN